MSVIDHTHIGHQCQRKTNGQNRGGSQQDVFPVALKFQVHEEHHHAQSLSHGNGHDQQDCHRVIFETHHVENNGQSGEGTQHYEDKNVVDMVAFMIVV